MEWERARSDQQKEQRINALVAATAHLFETQSFDAISLASIAKAAQFTRSNLYKYFQTKEDLFLELIKSDIIAWRADLVDTLAALEHPTPQIFAHDWVTVMMRHERLLRLYAILFTSLEKNCSVENLIAFKFALVQELSLLATVLNRLFPAMTLPMSTQFLTLVIALASGLYPMTQLSPAKKQALVEAQLAMLMIDFKQSLYAGTLALIKGFAAS